MRPATSLSRGFCLCVGSGRARSEEESSCLSWRREYFCSWLDSGDIVERGLGTMCSVRKIDTEIEIEKKIARSRRVVQTRLVG